MPRLFLTVVGGLYLCLALWCSIRPEETSKIVGFSLTPGSGQSEFLTVYGGLEFALALLFLQPLFRIELTSYALWNCLIVHASLVVFRTISFILHDNIALATYKLAAGEWMILIATGITIWRTHRSKIESA